MELDKISGWKQSTSAQWAAIQAYALTLRPVSQRSGLWPADNPHGECGTKCLDLLPKAKVKKHQGILRDMLRAPVAAVPVADPTPARNDHKLSPSVYNKDVPHMLILRQEVTPVRGVSVSQ